MSGVIVIVGGGIVNFPPETEIFEYAEEPPCAALFEHSEE